MDVCVNDAEGEPSRGGSDALRFVFELFLVWRRQRTALNQCVLQPVAGSDQM